jgi:D-glycero-alpha-D-manno-heptose-7-phosphate kinase
MHRIKQSSIEMKEAVLKGDILQFADILGRAWEDKKKMAKSITNQKIDHIFQIALTAGAITGKVSGAGGGGFIMFVVDPEKRIGVVHIYFASQWRMINHLEAQTDFQDIDFSRSVMIEDREYDMKFAEKIGIRGIYLK